MRAGFRLLQEINHDLLPKMGHAYELLNQTALQRRSGLSERDWNHLAKARDIEVVAAFGIKALQNQSLNTS